MTLDLAVPETTASGVVLDHEGILRSLNLNARDPKTQAMLLICERYNIDPLMKHAVLISGNIYITRDGYLHVAHRSGQFDGIEVLETGETPTHFTAKVAVHRKDMRHPFTYTGRFPKSERMAKTFGPEMAVKVAEVQALRRAFNVTGVAASDERWDVDPSEVVHAIAESSGGGESPASPPTSVPLAAPARSSADPETGELPPATTRRRPPPYVRTTPCPEGCGVMAESKQALVPHLVTDHGWTESGGKVHPPSSGTSSTAPALPPADDDGHDLSAGAGSPSGAPAGDPSGESGGGPVPSVSGSPPSTRSKRTTALMATATARFPDRQARLDWAADTLGRHLNTFTGLSDEDEMVLLHELDRQEVAS